MNDNKDHGHLYLVIIGDPVDGFSFIGPFDDGPAAVAWADKYQSEAQWIIAPMCRYQDVQQMVERERNTAAQAEVDPDERPF